MEKMLNEASVVGKTIFSDGKGKLFFGYYKTDDAVEFVDYKTWKKLSFKDVSKGDTNKERVIKAILKNQKQFNKKVDFNMWAKKQKRSFEDTMDWFIQNGWINNINKGGIKESIDVLSINEGKKRFKQQNGIGKSKYTISYHDGKKKHKDGSDFFDIKIFKNKPELEAFKKALLQKGFVVESVNESASKEAMGIAGFTGTRGSAVEDFITKNELNGKKLFNFIRKGSLKDRMDFVTALAGKPGNPIQTKVIKMFGESLNEAKFKVLASFGGYDLIEAPTEKDMIISKNGKKVGKLTKISKYLKDDIKSFINMVKSGKLGESVVNEAGVNVWYFYKKANKDKNKFFKMLSDFRKKHSDTQWIKMLNYALEDFNENPTKYKTIDDKQNILFKNLQTNKKVYESVNEGISVFDERHFGKKGIIIMIDDNGKKVSAIFKDKKNADKYNRNNPSDIQALLKIAKTKPFGKAIDESVNEEKPGLWANIRAKQKRGEKPAHKNSQAHKDAVKAGKQINNEAKFGYKDSTASYINKHKDEYKQAEKMNNGNEKKFYDMLQQMEEKVGHGKTMLFISNALRGYGVDMFKDPKIKNPQDAQEALFLLSK